MVFSKYKTVGSWLTLCGYFDNTLYTLYTQYTLVIRVKDDLFLVYQRRRWLFVGPFPAHCFCLLHFLKLYRPWEVPHRFKHKLSHRLHSKSCLGTPWGSSYDHIYKNMYFCKGWIAWQQRLKGALNTISNGILKVQNAWILVDIMQVLW